MFFDQFKYPIISEIRVNIHIAIAVRFECIGNNNLIQCIEITFAATKVSRR